MAVAIRLSRGGAKKRPYYRIVVSDSRAPRDGKYLEQIGTYNPMLPKDDEGRVKIDEDRARHWIGVGAVPSDRVARFLDKAGIVGECGRGQRPRGCEHQSERRCDRADHRFFSRDCEPGPRVSGERNRLPTPCARDGPDVSGDA